uniref:LR gamma6 n=1 Tax=Griffithsia pacifica TaxID=35689 RepID=A0A291FEB9_GRIPA|nr:LR gamma6 [Griffithsia pacifica]5Y6P_gy Chain gy, LR_gamma6 [Griffithsia pacifica]5Y6P_gz Chain gz, LR_gamma6 [Griffithsia pacifica]
MAFITSFTPRNLASRSEFTSTSVSTRRPTLARNTIRALFTPPVDEFMASSVQSQYIQKACPSGVPPIQCIEGVTSDQPYAARTLKRQTELRYHQLPVAVKLRKAYETRRAAVVATHGCSHEEGRVLSYPRMASAMLIGQAEASKACSRYFVPNGPAEKHMLQAVENRYMAAVNGSGVFSGACTDGQTRYEAYLMQLRGKSAEFRAKQYSTFEKESMKYAARKQALIQKGHDCNAEEVIFSNYPIVASAMRPTFGYYTPIVKNPGIGSVINIMRPVWDKNSSISSPATLVGVGGFVQP